MWRDVEPGVASLHPWRITHVALLGFNVYYAGRYMGRRESLGAAKHAVEKGEIKEPKDGK